VASQATALGNTNRDINASDELWNFFNAHKLCNTTVGINEQSIQIESKLYPNPARTELSLSTLPNEKSEITICNLLGQALIKIQNKNLIDISNLSNGIYIIIITNGQNRYTQKFIKE
jgi:hypothetical protein